jgi:hypothetical protein
VEAIVRTSAPIWALAFCCTIGVAAAVVQPLDMETPSHAGDTEGASAIPILLGLTDLFYKLFEHK